MRVLILGYGYCGYHLVRYLKSLKIDITTVSRHLLSSMEIEGVTHLEKDIRFSLELEDTFDVIFYLAPPENEGETDTRLAAFLSQNPVLCKCFVYFGSSGVYGDHKGAWVDEKSSCHLRDNRQKRRLDAERQLKSFAELNHINLVCLRISGIYGPGRLPIESVKAGEPIIKPDEAPWSNLIYVGDLVRIAYHLSQDVKGVDIFNVSDGVPRKMGALKREVANVLGIRELSEETLSNALKHASDLKKSFLKSSKKLVINKLKKTLPNFNFIAIEVIIKKLLV